MFNKFLAILFIPVIYAVSISTFPYIEPYFTKVAVISAGMPFLDGKSSLALNANFSDFENNVNVLDIEEVSYNSAPIEKSPIIMKKDENLAQEVSTIKPLNPGIINRKTFEVAPNNSYIPLSNGFIKNCTEIPDEKVIETVVKKPDMKFECDGTIEVLIMHTHTTESYQPTLNEWFSKDFNTRTIDNSQNVTAVGDNIEAELKKAGIGVIHDRTLHDYPSYNGSYARSAVTTKEILAENPDIKVVLDVHRDAIQSNQDTMTAPVTKIDGKDAAQVMIISGCDDGTMNMPNYMENLKLASLLQAQIETDYKSLTRPLLFDYRKYNQDLTTGSILLEMGGHANTLEEALYTGELVGASLAKALTKLK